jgi:hypothetical protein
MYKCKHCRENFTWATRFQAHLQTCEDRGEGET